MRWVEGKRQGHRQGLVILTLVMAAQGVACPHLSSFALGSQSKQQRWKLSLTRVGSVSELGHLPQNRGPRAASGPQTSTCACVTWDLVQF